MPRDEAIQVLKALERRVRETRLYRYRPFGHPDTLCPDGGLWKKNAWGGWSNKPWQLDFHNAGAKYQERGLISANRVGKTECAAAETAVHLTGEYPDWWEGRRFGEPVLAWCGSVTNEASRDIVQKALMGGMGEDLGTGYVPRRRILGKPRTRQAGIGDVMDTAKVRHVSGGVSQVMFKTYDQGWRKWQGTAPHLVWLDEEPDDLMMNERRIFTEALTRILSSHGVLLATFTPLLGATTLVDHFMEGGPGIFLETATWDDAPHLDRAERERLMQSYPEHERETRARGVPMMGEGRVFTTPEEEIRVAWFEPPDHFARIKGIDFGIDHPAAVVDIAWDRDRDILYVTRCWRERDCEVSEHAAAINEVEPWVPVSWPHDGTSREKSNGVRLKDQYAPYQVRLLGKSARYRNDTGGGQPVEPIILEIQERARDGRLKVFAGCTEFFDEWRNYHRKDGKLTKTRDDVLKACFYAVMMKRYAVPRMRRSRPQPAAGAVSVRL